MNETEEPALEFPIAPDWWSTPPDGGMDEGILFSERVIRTMGKANEKFLERSKQMVAEEFSL